MHAFEVICGARRHWTACWMRANNYPDFKFLIEPRELTDEEAFRLADLENRSRKDLSDYERARDYLRALERYFGGNQRQMAARLEVSPSWLPDRCQHSRREAADGVQGRRLAVGAVVGQPGLIHLHTRATECLGADLLAGARPHQRGSGQAHDGLAAHPSPRNPPCRCNSCWRRNRRRRISVVVPVAWIVSQNVAVENASTSAIDPPRVSDQYTGPVPPAWNSGRLTRKRSSASTSGKPAPIEYRCK